MNKKVKDFYKFARGIGLKRGEFSARMTSRYSKIDYDDCYYNCYYNWPNRYKVN